MACDSSIHRILRIHNNINIMFNHTIELSYLSFFYFYIASSFPIYAQSTVYISVA